MPRLRLIKPPIFVKLVLAFLLVIIPLYTISIYLNNWGASSVRDEISSSMKARVHFYIQSLYVEFDRIQKLQQEFINDDDLRMLSVASSIMTDLERTEATIRLENRLRLIKNSSRYITSMNAFVPELGKTIDSQNQYNSASQEELQPLIDAASRSESPIIPWKDKVYICQRYPDIGYPEALTFFLNLELSKQEIQRELEQFISFKDEKAVLFGSGFEWEVTNSTDPELMQHLQEIVEHLVQKGDSGTQMDSFAYNGERYILTLEHSAAFDITLLMFMPEENVLGPLKTYNVWFWILSIFSLVIVILFSFWIYRIIHRPLKQLVRTFRKVEKGNLDVQLKPTSNDEFEYLYLQFNSMLSQLKILIEEVYEEKIRSQKAELKQLQAQINPHFLYNTFFILNRMVKVEDYPKLRPFTRHLGNYFKFITRNASDEVPLREEIEFVKSYLEIQKIRFEDRIRVELAELPEAYEQTLVPRLTLQPIIENSFKYGLESVASGGLLRILFELQGKLFVIIVEDNGSGMSDEEIWTLSRKLSDPPPQLESTGVINVHKRLQLKYGPESGIAIMTSGKLGGLKVCLFIPAGEDC